MEKIKAYRHDLAASDPKYGIRGYECENGWYVDFYDATAHLPEGAYLHWDGKCRWVEGEDLARLKGKLELIEVNR